MKNETEHQIPYLVFLLSLTTLLISLKHVLTDFQYCYCNFNWSHLQQLSDTRLGLKQKYML